MVIVAAGDFPKEHQLHSKYFARNLSLEEARQMGWLVGWLVGWLLMLVTYPFFLGGFLNTKRNLG